MKLPRRLPGLKKVDSITLTKPPGAAEVVMILLAATLAAFLTTGQLTASAGPITPEAQPPSG
jgi:hypothetical protein